MKKCMSMHFLYIWAHKRQEASKRLERDKYLNKKKKIDGGDKLYKRKITVKTENKPKINYNQKKIPTQNDDIPCHSSLPQK